MAGKNGLVKKNRTPGLVKKTETKRIENKENTAAGNFYLQVYNLAEKARKKAEEEEYEKKRKNYELARSIRPEDWQRSYTVEPVKTQNGLQTKRQIIESQVQPATQIRREPKQITSVADVATGKKAATGNTDAVQTILEGIKNIKGKTNIDVKGMAGSSQVQQKPAARYVETPDLSGNTKAIAEKIQQQASSSAERMQSILDGVKNLKGKTDTDVKSKAGASQVQQKPAGRYVETPDLSGNTREIAGKLRQQNQAGRNSLNNMQAPKIQTPEIDVKAMAGRSPALERPEVYRDRLDQLLYGTLKKPTVIKPQPGGISKNQINVKENISRGNNWKDWEESGNFFLQGAAMNLKGAEEAQEAKKAKTPGIVPENFDYSAGMNREVPETAKSLTPGASEAEIETYKQNMKDRQDYLLNYVPNADYKYVRDKDTREYAGQYWRNQLKQAKRNLEEYEGSEEAKEEDQARKAWENSPKGELYQLYQNYKNGGLSNAIKAQNQIMSYLMQNHLYFGIPYGLDLRPYTNFFNNLDEYFADESNMYHSTRKALESQVKRAERRLSELNEANGYWEGIERLQEQVPENGDTKYYKKKGENLEGRTYHDYLGKGLIYEEQNIREVLYYSSSGEYYHKTKSSFLDPEDINNIRALYNAGMEDEAWAYYQALTPYLNKLMTDAKTSEWEEKARGKFGAFYGALAFGNQLVSAVEAPIIIGAALLGNEQAKDKNSQLYFGQRFTNTVREARGDVYSEEFAKNFKETAKILGLDNKTIEEAENAGKKWGPGVYRVFTTTVDNLIAAGMANRIPFMMQTIMSCEAASSEMLESVEKNYSPQEAAVRSIFSGVSEWFEEKIPAEMWLNVNIQGLLGSWGSTLGYIIKNGAVEAIQEPAGEILTTAFDYVASAIAGHENEIDREISDRANDGRIAKIQKEKNLTTAEATAEAFKQATIETWNRWKDGLGQIALESFASGALRAGGSVVGQQARNVATGYVAGQRSLNNMAGVENAQLNIDDEFLVRTAINMKDGTISNKLGTKLEGKIKTGSNLTWSQRGQLINSIAYEAGENIRSAVKDSEKRVISEELQNDNIEATQADQLAEIVLKAEMNGVESLNRKEKTALLNNNTAYNIYVAMSERENLEDVEIDADERSRAKTAAEKAVEAAKQETKAARTEYANVVSAMNGTGPSAVYRVAKIGSGRITAARQAARSTLNGNMTEYERAGGDIAKAGAAAAVINTQDAMRTGTIEGFRDGKVLVKYDGDQALQPVRAEDVGAVNEEAGAVVAYMRENPGMMTDAMASKIVATLSALGENAGGTFADEAVKINILARTGQALQDTAMPAEAAKALYAQGVEDFKAAEAARIKGTTGQTVAGKGKIKFGDALFGTKEFSEKLKSVPEDMRRQVTYAAMVDQQLGLNDDFYFDDSEEGRKIDGYYRDGVRVINLGAMYEDPATGEMKYKNPLSTIGHEGTHWLQENSPEGYGKFRSFILEELRRSGVDLEQKIQDTILRYNNFYASLDKNDPNYNKKMTIDEAVYEIVAEGAERLYASEEMVNRLKEQDPELHGKIKAFVQKWVTAIKDKLLDSMAWGLHSTARSIDIHSVDEMARIWLGGYDEVIHRQAIQQEQTEQRSAALKEEAAKYTPQQTKEAENIIRKAMENPVKSFGINESPVEVREDGVVAVHNLDESNLKKLLKLGGIPMPSIAVVSKDKGWTAYGPISVYFNQDALDFENGLVYNGDAFTPTLPMTEMKNTDQAMEYLRSQPARQYGRANTITDMFSRYRSLENMDEVRQKAYSDITTDSETRAKKRQQALKMEQKIVSDAFDTMLVHYGMNLHSDEEDGVMKWVGYGMLRAAEEMQGKKNLTKEEKYKALDNGLRESFEEALVDPVDLNIDGGELYDQMLDYIDFVQDQTSRAVMMEAKPNQVFNFKDGMVFHVPDNIKPATLQMMLDAGVSEDNILMYPANNYDARMAAQQALPYVKNVSFAIADTNGNEVKLTQNDIEENKTKISSMQPVINIAENRFSKNDGKDFRTMGTEYFESIGGKAQSKIFGEVELNEKGIKHLVNFLTSRRAGLLEAVKPVIENGELINIQEKGEGHNFDTALIAAPVVYEGNPYYMAVAVKQDEAKKNSYYIHDAIVAEIKDGKPSAIKTLSKQGLEGFPSIASLLTTIPKYNGISGKNEGNRSFAVAEKNVNDEQDSLYNAMNDARDVVNRLREEKGKLKPELDAWVERLTDAQENGNLDDVMAEYKEWEKGYTAITDELYNAEQEYKRATKEYDDYIEQRDVAEEQKKIQESGLNEADWRRKQAIKEFGYTTNFREAGYLLPNGKMLNFTGEKGKHYGTRGQDHRAISGVYASNKMQGGAAMFAFMKDGNIRVMAESPGIDLAASVEPTAAQYNMIRDMARRFADEEYFSVDLTDDKGYNAGNIEYEGRINPSKVVNDIKAFYRTGVVPEQSELSRFYAINEGKNGTQNGPDMDVNQWMMTVPESSLQTEAEKALLKDYKSLRIKISLDMERQRNYKTKIRELEAIENRTQDIQRKIDGYNIRLKNAQAAQAADEAKLAKITSSEGYAGMMYYQQRMMNDYVGGRTADEVQKSVERMEETAERLKQDLDSRASELENLAKTKEVQRVQSRMSKVSLDRMAQWLRKEYGSRINKQDLMNDLSVISLKIADGQDYAQDVEDLAGRILEGIPGEKSPYLEALRGTTIRLGPGQVKELLGSDSSMKELRKKLAGTGIRVQAVTEAQIRSGEKTGLDSNWDELCDMIPALNRDTGEKDQVNELMGFISSQIDAQNTTGRQQYAENLADMMIDVQTAAMAVDTSIVTDPKAKAQIAKLQDIIMDLSGRTEEMAGKMRDMSSRMDELIAKGKKSLAWADSMKRDVRTAIDYFNKTAKLAIDQAKKNRQDALIQQMKDEHIQKMLKNNEEWRNLIQRDAQARRQAEDNAAKRRQMTTVATRLAKLLSSPTTTKNIPEHMQGLAREILSTFVESDLSGMGRKITNIAKSDLMELQRRLDAWKLRDGDFNLADLNAAENPIMQIVNDDLMTIYDSIKEWNGRYNGKNKLDTLQMMNTTLKRMQEATSELYSVIQREREVAMGNRRADLEEQAFKVRQGAAGKTAKEWRGKIGRSIAGLHKAIISGNMTPEYFFRNIGNEGLNELWDVYHWAENRNGLELAEAQEKIQDIADKYGYKNWDMKTRTPVKLDNGNTVNMTLGQIMSLWATWNREQTLGPEMSQHLTKGGFYTEQQDLREGLLGKTQIQKTANRVTEADMDRIGDMLTEEQKNFVNDIVKFMSTDLSRLGNAASMQAYGIKLYKENYYFPFKMWDGIKSRKSNDSGSAANMNQAFHPSFAKSRQHGANNALIIGDFMQTVADHAAGMINYATMGLANDSFQKVLNFNVTEGYGDTETKRNIRAILEEAYGQEAMRYLAVLQEQLNGGAVYTDKTVYDKALSLFRKNAVAGSLSVAAQQPLSYIRAAMMINPKYLAMGLNPATWKGSYREMVQHSGVAVIKDMGRFDMGFGQSAREYLTPEGKENGVQKAWNKVTDKATALPQMMDRMTWTRMWTAVKAEQKAQHPEMDVKSDEFLDLCGERFNDLMRRTQVYDSTLVKSQNMRSQNPAVKSITSFMAEPTLTANVMMDALRQAKNGEKGGKLALAKAGATFILSAVLQAAVKGLMGAGRNPDKEKTFEENLLYRFGNALISEINPISLIPGYSDLVTLLKNGEISDDAMGAIGKMFTAGKTGIDALLGNGKKDVYRDIEDSAGQLVQLFTNLPAKNIMRDARAMYNFITQPYAQRETSGTVLKYQLREGVVNSDSMLSVINKWMGDAGYKTTKKAYKDRIKDLEASGNIEEAEELREYLGLQASASEQNSNAYMQEQMKNGKATAEETKAKLKELYPERSEDSIWWTVDRMEYENETGKDAGSGKYYRLTDAIENNDMDTFYETTEMILEHGGGTAEEEKCVTDALKEGKISRETATEMVRYIYNKDEKTDDDVWWIVDKAEYQKDTGKNAGSGKYYRLTDAIENNDMDTFYETTEMILEHGGGTAEEEKCVTDALKEGKISREIATEMVRYIYNKDEKTDDDVWWIVDKAEYQKDTGKNAGSGKYYRLWDAMDNNKADEIGTAVEQMTAHGVEAKNIKSQITSHYRDAYKEADSDGKRKIRDAMHKAYKKLGYTVEDADKVINKWK